MFALQHFEVLFHFTGIFRQIVFVHSVPIKGKDNIVDIVFLVPAYSEIFLFTRSEAFVIKTNVVEEIFSKHNTASDWLFCCANMFDMFTALIHQIVID